MEHDYKPTTHGRALIAACMDLEQPLKLTRVAVGSGRVDEGANLADMHELVRYVAEGAIGERRHEDDRFYLTIQYSNSDHPDVATFYLSEFMVYAEDPVTGEETDLIYATLGDYIQPVPAYKANYPACVFNFPLVLIISDEIEVSITASPGLITYDDLQNLLNEGVIGISHMDLTIPSAGWVTDEDTGGAYALHADVAHEGILERMKPELTILPAGLELARRAELCPTVRTLPGLLRLYAQRSPEADIAADLALMGGSGYISTGPGTVIPAATENTLGGVKIGSGVKVRGDGTISVDSQAVIAVIGEVSATAEDTKQLLDGVFGGTQESGN